ncbi:hypothetical protein [uncultured Deinococcus sp.]|uniref:hypothetical protein n=1 Tax=uncultured Deinococcus sp. TaxID=158789 RepID=UPI00258817DC|nr:hypothetical protein [uncultured Deinococcus sp.]
MRDNTPTARLEDTPTPEQDLSTTPEPDFEFQEGQDTILARAALPQVAGVTSGPQPGHLALTLEGGEQVHISPDLVKWAALQPGGRGVPPMVFIAWPDRSTSIYAVPDALLPELLVYFPDPEEQS